MRRMSRGMSVGKAKGAEGAKAEQAAAAVQTQKAEVGPQAQQEARLEARQADHQQDAQAQQEDARRDERKQEQKDEVAQDASRAASADQRQDGEHQRGEESQVDEQIDRAARQAPEVRLDQDQQLEQARRDDETLDDSRDHDQLDDLRRGEERGAEDRMQLDQANFRDEQQQQEKDVGEQGTKMLRESEEQQQASREEETSKQEIAQQQDQAQPQDQMQPPGQIQEHGQEQGQQQDQTQQQDRTQDQDQRQDQTQKQDQTQQQEARARAQLFAELRRQNEAFQDLDDAALERVLEYANEPQKMRGQLVEEKGHLQLEKIAADLGPDHRFLRGDQIKDQKNQQLTDGMLVREAEDGSFDLVAVAEAKAGKASRRELQASRETFSNLSARERENLQKAAIDALLAEQGHDDPANRPAAATHEKMLEKHPREIEALMRDLHGNDMGQIRQDIERLTPNAGDNDVTLKIDGEDRRLRASPANTKIYTVTPRDVSTDRMLENFKKKEPALDTESLYVDFTAREATQLVEALLNAEQAHRSRATEQASGQQQAVAEQAVAEQAVAEQAVAGQTVAEQAVARPAVTQQMVAEQAVADQHEQQQAADLARTAARQTSQGADHSQSHSGKPAAWDELSASHSRVQTATHPEVDLLEQSRELARQRLRELRQAEDALELFDDD